MRKPIGAIAVSVLLSLVAFATGCGSAAPPKVASASNRLVNVTTTNQCAYLPGGKKHTPRGSTVMYSANVYPGAGQPHTVRADTTPFGKKGRNHWFIKTAAKTVEVKTC